MGINSCSRLKCRWIIAVLYRLEKVEIHYPKGHVFLISYEWFCWFPRERKHLFNAVCKQRIVTNLHRTKESRRNTVHVSVRNLLLEEGAVGIIECIRYYLKYLEHITQWVQFGNFMVYLSDAIVFSRIFDQHLEEIDNVLRTLPKARVSLKLKKCDFSRRQFSTQAKLRDQPSSPSTRPASKI